MRWQKALKKAGDTDIYAELSKPSVNPMYATNLG